SATPKFCFRFQGSLGSTRLERARCLKKEPIKLRSTPTGRNRASTASPASRPTSSATAGWSARSPTRRSKSWSRRPDELRPRPGVVTGARVLRRIVELDAEALRRVPHPARVVEEGARHRHHVGLALGDGRFGLFGIRDHPDRAYFDF